MVTVSAGSAELFDPSGEIRKALPALRRATGLPVVFGGLVGAPVGGVRSLRISELLGANTDSLRGLRVRSGTGLGGKAIRLGRPAWVGDYMSAATITHDYDAPVGAEGLRSTLAVPVVVRGEVRGVLYAALRQEIGLGDRPLTAAMAVARELEQDLVVRDEATRAVTELRLAALRADGADGADAAGAPWSRRRETARREELRHLHVELRSLAERVADEGLRRDLLSACARLAATADPARAEPYAHVPGLSPRELDVLGCVALGHTNATAARQLGLLPETVKSYLRSAMRKLGSHTRLEAVTTARRAGLLP